MPKDSVQTPPWDPRASARIHELEVQVQDALHLQETLEERLRFEKMLSEISSAYTNLPASEVDQTIEYGLQRLGKFFHADRCNLAQFPGGDNTSRTIHTWRREGVRAVPENALYAGVWNLFPWTLQRLMRGEVAQFSRLEELPAEAEVDKKNYGRFGYQSQILVPIAVGGTIVCAISIDALIPIAASGTNVHAPSMGSDISAASWKYTDTTVDRLRRAGEIFANAVVRKQKELEIHKLKDQLEADCTYLREEIEFEYNTHNMIGQSTPLKQVLFQIQQVAAVDVTVLVLGETGTGKELVARAIHSASHRKDRPMVKLNCASLPASLIESELFGHEKGAFTSAQARQVGRFELADGNTLFLDEIGEMPLESQAKLLRVLQEGEFERLGSSRTIKVDVRIIAATNRNLEEEVKAGRFRQDLWYRLNVFPITLPPLQQRKEDIPLLANMFVNKFNKKLGKAIKRIPANVMNVLMNYHWPGNIRELENVIERAAINTQGTSLQLLDNLEDSQSAILTGLPTSTLEATERNAIVRALERTNWRISGPKGAAVILGIHHSTLRFRMEKLGIQRNEN